MRLRKRHTRPPKLHRKVRPLPLRTRSLVRHPRKVLVVAKGSRPLPQGRRAGIPEFPVIVTTRIGMNLPKAKSRISRLPIRLLPDRKRRRRRRIPICRSRTSVRSSTRWPILPPPIRLDLPAVPRLQLPVRQRQLLRLRLSPDINLLRLIQPPVRCLSKRQPLLLKPARPT
jgi:hypothetical protein